MGDVRPVRRRPVLLGRRRKTKLEDRLTGLGRLQFRRPRRLSPARRAACRISPSVSPRAPGRRRLSVVRAARLMKADLSRTWSASFRTRRASWGGLYARREGERDEAWQSIYDQYRPVLCRRRVPAKRRRRRHRDRGPLSTRCPLFGLGLAPTGSRDPYALRRAALGIVKILLDRNLHLDLPVAISDALQLHGALARRREDVVPELSAFLSERLRFLLEKKGRRPDTVDAVLAADARDPADAAERAEAVDAMRGEPDFALLAAAFKRMQNILAQAPDAAGEPDPEKLTDAAEQALAGDFLQARGMIDDLLAQRRFPDALGTASRPRPRPLFTEVSAAARGRNLKANRIALLAPSATSSRVAHFGRSMTREAPLAPCSPPPRLCARERAARLQLPDGCRTATGGFRPRRPTPRRLPRSPARHADAWKPDHADPDAVVTARRRPRRRRRASARRLCPRRPPRPPPRVDVHAVHPCRRRRGRGHAHAVPDADVFLTPTVFPTQTVILTVTPIPTSTPIATPTP